MYFTATIELTKRTKSKIMNREDYSYVSPQPLRWGSDTALNVDKDEVLKCSSDQDLEGITDQRIYFDLFERVEIRLIIYFLKKLHIGFSVYSLLHR